MRNRAPHALVIAAACAALLALLGLITLLWPAERGHDAESLAGFIALASNARIDRVAAWVAHTSTPVAYGPLATLLSIVPLLWGLPRRCGAQ